MLLRSLFFPLAVLSALALWPGVARAAQSYDNCTGFIDTLPATISTQGTWCLRHDLTTAITSGAAITVAANNVTLDCNDFKLGGLQAGAATWTDGISSSDRMNLTVRRCNVRGFFRGLNLVDGGLHVIEDNRFDGNTTWGIRLDGGDGSVVRRNVVLNTGGGTVMKGAAIGIFALGSTDILDNTIVGVLPSEKSGFGAEPLGIQIELNSNGSIVGNRIRGLQRIGRFAYGIYITSSMRMQVRDNDIGNTSGAWDSVGVYCEGPLTSAIATGNITSGFQFNVLGCVDDGTNL